jgi:hypothetical protein
MSLVYRDPPTHLTPAYLQWDEQGERLQAARPPLDWHNPPWLVQAAVLAAVLLTCLTLIGLDALVLTWIIRLM